MTLKRHTYNNLHTASVSFCNPTTGEMIDHFANTVKFKVDKKTGLTKLATFLDACTSDRLFIVGKLTDTTRAYFETEVYSQWVGNGIFDKRSYTFKKEDKKIELRAMCLSFFRTCTDVGQAYDAYHKMEDMLLLNAGIPVLTSPSVTGSLLLEMNLPYNLELDPLEDKYSQLIHDNTTQPRQEVLTQKLGDTISDFYYLDGRWMYAACLDYEYPCGQPIYDDMPFYQKYAVGWYYVHFTVPSNWQHVGILPVKKDKSWYWPNTPNETYTGWICEPELRVAVENGWNIKVINRLLFPKGRPFRNWKTLLVDMREDASKIEDVNIRKHITGAFREMMLHAIGRMYSREWKREEKLTLDEYAVKLESMSVESRLRTVRRGNYMYVPVTEKLAGKDEKWLLPYLPAYVWSYCRRLVTLQLLQLPYDAILGCRLDGIYLSENPNIEDTGKIGAFRLKGELHGTYKTPRTNDEISVLAHLSEYKN
jgi:hypothetical protein